MANVTLDDLLAKKAASQESLVDESKEVASVTQQVEMLTQEERQEVDRIKDAIDLGDSASIVQYGNRAQKNIADFSDSILSNVRSRDLDTAGELLKDLSLKVREFSDDDKCGFLSSLPIVGALFRKKDAVMESFHTLGAQVEKIQSGLEQQKIEIMKDIVMFDGLYDKNLEYFKQLQLFIQAGEEKITELRTVTLPQLEEQAKASSNPMAGQVVKDYEEAVVRFEKKVHDLKISKVIAIQTAPQIRLIQNNDKILVSRIQSAIYNTIPLWKNQLVLALGLNRQKDALAVQKAVSDSTNELLQKNAEILKQNSLETARENERSIVDVETVKKVNQDLIATIEETLKIQQEGRAKRQAAEQELVQIENQLRETLLRNSNR